MTYTFANHKVGQFELDSFLKAQCLHVVTGLELRTDNQSAVKKSVSIPCQISAPGKRTLSSPEGGCSEHLVNFFGFFSQKSKGLDLYHQRGVRGA